MVRTSTRTTIGAAARAIIAAVEPWYDWGTINVDRMEGSAIDHDSGWGDVRYLTLQWFGVHVGIQIGRTPKKEVR